MDTATFVKAHPARKSTPECWYGEAALYRISPPYIYDADKPPCDYLFVSSSAPGGRPETYAFPADEAGDCLSWTELRGSVAGTSTHREVLLNIGYDLVSAPEPSAAAGDASKEGT